MPQGVIQNLGYARIVGLSVALVLLATACGSSTIPVPFESPTEPGIPAVEGTSLDDALHLQYAQDNSLRFDRLSVEQGLSQGTVFSILQDSQGFMWFGTEDGLNRYDGYSFTIYRPDPDDPGSLSDNWIWSIHEDREGKLWIGTRDGGLDRYDRELDHFTHYRHDSDDPDSLSHNEVRFIYEDHEGVLWIGTGGGLDRFDPESESFIHYQHDPDDPHSLNGNTVLSIYEDRDGVLWIGTDGGGLDRFDRDSKRFTHFRAGPRGLSDNRVRSIYEDRDGVLWIGTDGGLNSLDRETEIFTHYQHDPNDPRSLSDNAVWTIYEDREGILWIGTDGGGLDYFDRKRECFVHSQNNPDNPRSLSNHFIRSIYEDREGMLWIGTLAGGLNRVGVGNRHFLHLQNEPNSPDSLGNNWVRSIYEDREGVLWIGTGGAGLDRFDPVKGEWRHYRHDPHDPDSLSDNWVSLLHQDQAGTLWIGTGSGLDRLDPSTGRFSHYQHEPDDPHSLSESDGVWAIYEDTAGMLWIGTHGGGLDRLDREREHFTHYRHNPDDAHSLAHDDVWMIFEDREGVLWIGTGGGLDRFEPETESFVHFQHEPDDPDSLSDDFVGPIYEDRAGNFWIGTIGGGLNRLDRSTGTFAHYGVQDGLPSPVIMGILEDEQGNLWLSTNSDLSKFDPRAETFRNYDETDGLPFKGFTGGTFIKGSNGEMLAGGLDGFIVFYPDRVRDNPYVPPIVLTALTQDGEDVAWHSAGDGLPEVTFRWPDNSFEFEFAALSYVHPEENQYAYMLEGLDDDWNMIGARRFGLYTHVPGGTYTLRIIGSNNDGVWNEEGVSLKLTIMPPFWATWWFRGIILLALLGAVFGGYRLRVRSIEAHSRELERQVEERTAELRHEIDQRMKAEEALRQSEKEQAVAAERSRLARDLHDSVTQSLYSLTLFAEAARHMAEDTGHEPIQTHVGHVGRIAQQALREMRLLVYELRPPILEEEGLIRALRRRLEAVERRAGVEGRLVVDELARLPRSVEQDLYHIAQEALNNALKHALASSVVIYLREEEGRVELEIVDDGLGFEPEAMRDQGGMGLENIRQRAERMGGVATIRSIPGEGTSVKVAVDLNDKPEEPESPATLEGDSDE